jgi:serine/threonine protein kinase
MSGEEIGALITEQELLCNNSPFLLHLRESFRVGHYACMVLDFIEYGDLQGLIATKFNGNLPDAVIVFLAAELIMALEYLHTNETIYRDLKNENILIDSEGHICLSDFGLSKKKQRATR